MLDALPASARPWAERLAALDIELWQSRAFWQPVPFYEPAPGWTQTHPALAHALLGLNDAQVHALDNDADALCHWLEAWLPRVGRLPALGSLEPLEGMNEIPDFPTGFEWDIPGRKWMQTVAFATRMPATAERYVDWCCGKGHLARVAHHLHARPVTGLEIDGTLVDAGNLQARRKGLAVAVVAQDVMAADAGRHLDPRTHVMALHACGDLHLQLLREVPRQQAAGVSLSPCCYHKTRHETPDVLNADILQLQPSRGDLALAVQQTVTARAHERRTRERETAWRLAWRVLAEGVGNTLPAAPGRLPAAWFRGDFQNFCNAVADATGARLPAGIAFDAIEAQGWQRLGEVQRLELVRHAFRRPLEVWLCLDRAVWLARHGYEVEIGTFCAASTTPRNIMIRARLLAGDVLA